MIKNKKDKQEKTNREQKEVEIKISDPDDSAQKENAGTQDNEVNNVNEESKVNELEQQIAQLKDQYLRAAAEFENYKRRTDSEKAEFFAYASERLLTDLLPVVDDFNRTMDSFEKSHDNAALKKGIDLVYDKFKTALGKQGLREMDSDGKKFDVKFHEAIMQQPDESKEPETILNTVEKGYFLKDKVLRHAKVVVSAKPE
ncbi:MAG: nucleotide exchange factor GrpE [Ignavibacteria bacterium]